MSKRVIKALVGLAVLVALYNCGTDEKIQIESAPYGTQGHHGSSGYDPYNPYNPYCPYSPYGPYSPYNPYGPYGGHFVRQADNIDQQEF